MDDHARPPGLQPRFETVAECGQLAAVLVLLLLPKLQGGLHANGQGDRLRARPHAFLLMAAKEHGGQGEIRGAQSSAPMPSGPWNLCAATLKRGHAQPAEVDRHFAGSRDRVGVQRHSGRAA